MVKRWRGSVLLLMIAMTCISSRLNAQSTSLVISQFYSSQSAKSVLRNDFIEIFNRGASTVDLSGWSVQVSAGTSTVWDTFNLTGSVAAGQYYLISGQAANIDDGIYPLPTPFLTTSAILPTDGGRIALNKTTDKLDGECPTDKSIADFVGYGSGNSCTGSAGPTLTAFQSDFRRGGGCTDTDVNPNDFNLASPIPRTTLSSRNFCGSSVESSIYATNVPSGGGISKRTDGTGTTINIGSARYTPDSPAKSPTGMAIFGLRQNGVLITEATVPAATLTRSALVYVEVNGTVNTGVAITNPSNDTVNVSFTFLDASKAFPTGFGVFSIPPNGQIARFVNELPFGLAGGSTGSLELTATAPVGVIALRGLTNERNDFLITTLPIIDRTATTSTDPNYLAHFAVEGGWRTRVVLLNPTEGPVGGTVEFLDTAGQGTSVPFTGFSASSIPYSIAPKGAFTFTITGNGTNIKSGSVRITSSSGPTPAALAVFSYRQNNVTVSEAGITGSSGKLLRTYVEASGAAGQTGAIQSGYAIVNTSTTQTASVDLELVRLNGTASGIPKVTVTLGPSAKISEFLNQRFPTLPSSFQGLLRVTTAGSVTFVGLRTRLNERGDFLFTTVPAVAEVEPTSSDPVIFPHIVDSAGYTTQFILFGPTGLATTGNLQSYSTGGQPLALQIQ